MSQGEVFFNTHLRVVMLMLAMLIWLCRIVEIVSLEILNGTAQQPFPSMSRLSVWCQTKRQTFDSGELRWPRSRAVCDLVTHAELLTVPSRAHVRTKQASSGGATGAVLWHSVACWWVCRSLAVNGPPTAPLLVPWPLVFPSHYTHTKKRHWHRATFLMRFPARELGVLLQTCLSCVT